MLPVSTYRIAEIFIDVKLSLATGSGFIEFAEQFQRVTQTAACFSFASFVANDSSYNKQIIIIIFFGHF